MRHLLCAIALSLAGGPLYAADFATAWVTQLRLDGYEEITLTRTWLGRLRIHAEKGDVEREIVLNPRTGEVLRDYSRADDGSLRLPLGFEVELGNDSHNGGDRGGSNNGGNDDGGDGDGNDDNSGGDDSGGDDNGED